MRAQRARLLVVVLGQDQGQTDAEADYWRGRGAVVMRAHDASGCLRIATAVGPDRIVIGRGVEQRLLRLLKAHPVSAAAQIQWLPAVESNQKHLAA